MLADGVAGILLAAGGSTRFGGDKLSADLFGRTVLQRSVSAMLDAGLAPVVVVVQPDAGVQLPEGAVAIGNPHWLSGIASSIQAGIRAARADDSADAVVVAPADQPRCGPAVYRRLLDAYRADGTRPVVAAYDGALRNPVLLPRDRWRIVDDLRGDSGLSQVVRDSAALALECADVGSVDDVDTPEDLARVRREIPREER